VRQDRIASLIFFLLGILVSVDSARLLLGDIHNPGPGFVPFFLGLAMAILSTLSFFMPTGRKSAEAFWNNWQKGKNVFAIFAGMFIYLVLLSAMGFYLDTLWFLVYLIRLSGGRSYARSFRIAVPTMIVVYLVFGRLLIIPFPRGILGL
jgi:putative tricarboxylic transport membrane protein